MISRPESGEKYQLGGFVRGWREGLSWLLSRTQRLPQLGHTPEETLANIQEAVELYVEDLRAAGELIPVDPEKGAVEWPSPSVVVNV